ncbi:MAG: hypothetical protein IJW00_01705 [Clostridia bacterium]|nr:hypothetical protein [Clostridia bacterium]
MLKKLIIAFVVVAVLAAGAITVSVLISSKPEIVVKNTLENTVDALMDRQEFSTVLSMLKKGSLEVEGEFENTELGGKLYFSNIGTPAKQELFAEDLYLKNGEHSLSLSGYIGPDSAYITDCSVLEGTVGLIRGNAEADYLASVFAADSGSAFALDPEAHDLVTVFLRLYDEEADKKLEKDAKKYIKKYEKKMGQIFAEHATFEEATKKIRVNGTRMECRVMTVTVSTGDLADMLSDLQEALQKDKSLRKAVLSYQPYLEDQVEDLSSTYDEDFLNGHFWVEWRKYLRDMEVSLTVELVTPKSSALLRQLTVKAEVSGETRELLFMDLGKNGMKKADYITLEMGGVTYAYEIAEDNTRLFEAYLHMDKVELAHLEINRKEDVYSLTLFDGTVISGEFIEKKDQVTVSLEKIKNGDSFKLFDVSLTLREKDDFPAVAKDEEISSIFTLGEEALEKLPSATRWRGAYEGMMQDGTRCTIRFYPNGEMDVFTRSHSLSVEFLEGRYWVIGDMIFISHDVPESGWQGLNGLHSFEKDPNRDNFVIIDGIRYDRAIAA